ncbi:ras GTPase-activating-like protein IQGAP2 [Bolinopsis microptera]|uniref:ras GTPase-activating-like protein IQGAP2 n=1 Tax=Bolinopsis microptera TaxID=2820187 RepID=UPI003079A372
MKKSKKGDRRKTARYSAHKLYEKGVLVEIEKVPTSSFKAVTIEFSSTDQVGVFEVSGKLSGFNIDKFNVVFENLLQLQYERVSTLKFEASGVVFNVKLLISFLNKKFYGVYHEPT